MNIDNKDEIIHIYVVSYLKITVDTDELTNLLKTAIRGEMNKLGLGAFVGPLENRIEGTINYLASKSHDEPPKESSEDLKKMILSLKQKLNEKIAEINKLQELIKQSKLIDVVKVIDENKKLKMEIQELNNKIQKLYRSLQAKEEEINRLYNLTEDDPKYQAYYVLRDEAPNWVSYVHISNLTGIPISTVKKILKDFEMRGLIETRDKEARCLMVIRRTK